MLIVDPITNWRGHEIVHDLDRHLEDQERAIRAEYERVIVSVGDLEIDLGQCQVRRAGAEVHLTRTEWRFIELLARRAPNVVPYREFVAAVLGPAGADDVPANYCKTFVNNIRGKLGDRRLNASRYTPVYTIIATVPHVGYRLNVVDIDDPRRRHEWV
jgi:two-component system KDP operon response regulator KdpE